MPSTEGCCSETRNEIGEEYPTLLHSQMNLGGYLNPRWMRICSQGNNSQRPSESNPGSPPPCPKPASQSLIPSPLIKNIPADTLALGDLATETTRTPRVRQGRKQCSPWAYNDGQDKWGHRSLGGRPPLSPNATGGGGGASCGVEMGKDDVWPLRSLPEGKQLPPRTCQGVWLRVSTPSSRVMQ